MFFFESMEKNDSEIFLSNKLFKSVNYSNILLNRQEIII